MNLNWPRSASRNRWPLWIALLLLPSGCVGHREARRVSTGMIQTSEKATKVVNELKAAAAAEVQAQQETRRALDSMHQAWFKSRQALALSQAYGEFLRVSNRVSTDLAGEQAGLRSGMRLLTTNLSTQVAAAVQPLAERANQLLKTSREAAQALSNAPGELRLMKSSAEADRAYLAALGRKIEFERDGFRNGVLRLGENDQAAMTLLADTAAGHWSKIREVYDKGVENILTFDRKPLDLGPEPISNTNVFTDLADYTAAMGKCGEALQEYFVFNSFGKGSMFDTMLTSLAQGFIKALPIVGNGKGVSWSEAGDAGSAFFKQAVTELKGNLNEAGETARADLKSAANQALQSIAANLQTSLQNTMQNSLTNLNRTTINE